MRKILTFCSILLFNMTANAQSIDLQALLQQEIDYGSKTEYTEAFNELDTNNDGILDKNELLKFQQTGLSDNKDKTFELFDTNNDNRISKKEYFSLYKNQSSQNAYTGELEQNFNSMDTDKNGFLSSKELKNYRVKNLDEQNDEIFNMMDLNHNGEISENEFGEFMTFTKSILGNFSGF